MASYELVLIMTVSQINKWSLSKSTSVELTVENTRHHTLSVTHIHCEFNMIYGEVTVRLQLILGLLVR